ncbi:MAG: sulfate ABC transporter substrate-binding protein [Intestinibacter sp.]
MKRKILALTLSATLLAGSLVGCSSSNKSSSSSSASASASTESVELLNVSYDPTRELYEEYNKKFAEYWKDKTGQEVTINQSHGGSGKQGRSVIEGLDADVVTLALAYDIDEISQAGLIEEGWQSEFENNSCPYTSSIVFLVRKGNPKNIQDWDDLVKDGVEVITPNPKTSGGARWNYLAAWAYGLEKFDNDEEKVKGFIKDLYANVSVLDSGARGATTTFVENKRGDVLIAWENEALLALDEYGDEYEIVTPSISILAEPPVAIVDKVADEKGTQDIAKEYLEYLYTDEGQEIIAKNYYRPSNEKILEKYKDTFPELKLYKIDDVFGGWAKAQETHFADGGVFDQIYEEK